MNAYWVVAGLLVILAVYLVLEAIFDWYVEDKRRRMDLPEPDTIEARNARSLARYYAAKRYADEMNKRWLS